MSANDRFRAEQPQAHTRARTPSPEPMATLHAGQGAEVTTRKNAAHAADLARLNAEKRFRKRHAQDISSKRLHESAATARRGAQPGAARAQASAMPEGPERTRKNIFILVGGAILVLVLVFCVARCVTGLLTPKAQTPEQGSEDQQQPLEPQQSEQDADGTVKWNGVTYSVGQGEDGAWMLYAAADGADRSEVCRLDGEPSGIILYNGILVIPETLSDGWDVLAYMPGDGSLPTKVAGQDGSPVTGSGSIESATLDGSSVVVKDSTGATTTVAL